MKVDGPGEGGEVFQGRFHAGPAETAVAELEEFAWWLFDAAVLDGATRDNRESF